MNKTMKQMMVVTAICVFSGSVSAAPAQDVNTSTTPFTERPVNVRVSPALIAIGMVNAAAEWKWDNNWTVGPTAGAVGWAIGDDSLKGWYLGAQGTYFFNGAFQQGWYLSPSILYRTLDVSFKDGGSKYEGSNNGFVARGVGGYQWFWGNFNVNLGAGVAYNTNASFDAKDVQGNKSDKSFTNYTGITPAVDLQLGYVF